jgi:hypothetical protein
VKGGILEKLADSDPMYKRIQALDNSSLNIYESMLLDEVTAIKKGPYNQEEIESALKSFPDKELSTSFKLTLENVQSQEKQHTDAPPSESILHSSHAPVPNSLSFGNHESSPDGFVPIAEINGIEVAAASVEPEQQLRPHSEEDGSTDPEVVWALGILEKLIAHFNSKKAAGQTCESRDPPGVQNGTVDNPESACSTAKVDSFHDSDEFLDSQEGTPMRNSMPQRDIGGIESSQLTAPSVDVAETAAAANGKENWTKHSPITGDFDRDKRVGSDEMIITLPEGQQIMKLPHSQRGFRFFRFRKRYKDKEKKPSKRHDQTLVIEYQNQVHEI